MRLDLSFDEELMLDYARYASASQLETIVRGAVKCAVTEGGAARQQAEPTGSYCHPKPSAG